MAGEAVGSQSDVPASAIRTPTFGTPIGTVATEPVLFHWTTPFGSVAPFASGTVQAGRVMPVAESLHVVSAAPVESSTKVAIAATGFTSGTPIGRSPRELDSLRISMRAWALIAGRRRMLRNRGTTPRNNGRFASVALTSPPYLPIKASLLLWPSGGR